MVSLIAVAALIRVAVLHARPVWKDERHTIALAQMPCGKIIQNLSNDVHPPLYFVVIGLWARVFGASAESLRSFSALCGIAMLPLLFAAGRWLVGRDSAIAAVLFTSFSPIHVYYSAEARSYTLVELLTFCSTLSVLQLSREAHWKWVAVYVVTMTAALYTHYWSAFVLLASNLYWILFVRPFVDRRWAAWVGAQIAVATMLLPWLPVIPGQLDAGHGDWIRATAFDAPLKTLFRFTSGWDFPFGTALVRALDIVLVAPYLVVLAAGALRPANDDERSIASRRDLVFLFATPIMASYCLSLLVKPMYVIGRFEMAVFPIFALLLGCGFTRVGRTLQVMVLVALGLSSALHMAIFLGISVPSAR